MNWSGALVCDECMIRQIGHAYFIRLISNAIRKVAFQPQPQPRCDVYLRMVVLMVRVVPYYPVYPLP